MRRRLYSTSQLYALFHLSVFNVFLSTEEFRYILEILHS